MTVYANPGTEGAVVNFRERYENFIGGEWVPPAEGRYLENISPVTGKVFCEVPRSTAPDVEAALDAAHAAKDAWGRTSPAERANVLLRIADRIEENLEALAVAETWDNGKAVRETLAAELPLAVDHFRYFAGALRAQEDRTSQIDHDTVAYHFHEPIGVVAQIIPWNFPILMAAWKLAPALAAGNAVVLKPAEQTPASILLVAELIADIVPDGVLNIVNGLGEEAGAALSGSDRIGKIAFTGSTEVGKMINRAVADKIIPVTLELGGKSPSIFFPDIMDADDAFRDKAVEGFAMFALNQGEVCTCPSRALVHESIADEFLELGVERVRQIRTGNPLDTDTMMGAQASQEQMDRPRRSRWTRSAATSTSAPARARRHSSAARPPSPRAPTAATTSSRRSSSATTRCASSRRRSSGRCSRWRRSATSTRPWRSPTTPTTASAPACGRGSR